MNEDFQSRRSFLKTTGLILGASLPAQLVSNWPISSAEAATLSNWHYQISPWTGDDFKIGHEMRDADFPQFPTSTESTVDFVIIGGGIAGLTAAHYLSNYNYLLLEQYDNFGGQSRGGSFNGIDYSFGPSKIEVPQGGMEQLLDEINLHPVIINNSQSRFKINSATEKYWQFLSTESKRQNQITRDLKKFIVESKPIWQQIKDGPLQVPLIDAQLSKLDSLVFKQSLTGYSEQFIDVLDSMCRVATCLGVDKISALAGYEVASELTHPRAIFKGGNSAITKAIESSLRDKNRRCQTNSFVWAVEIGDKTASVIYSDKNGQMHKVACKHVIVASPLMVSARILRNIDNAVKAKMLGFRYGSYLIANFLLKNPVMSGCASNFMGGGLAIKEAFLAEAPYQQLGEYSRKMGSVLTLYQPYAPGSEGRTVLLDGNREKLARSVAEAMEPLTVDLKNQLNGIVLTRWGHAMATPTASYFQKMTALSASLTGVNSFSLAHCSTQGMPSAESAVAAAKASVDKALGKK